MFPGTIFRRWKRLAAGVLLVMLIPNHLPDGAASAVKPLSLDDLHYELWKRDWAPTFTQTQAIDFLCRFISESIEVNDPNRWRDVGGTAGTVTPHEAALCGGERNSQMCRQAGDL
jgi:hypothetical protein